MITTYFTILFVVCGLMLLFGIFQWLEGLGRRITRRKKRQPSAQQQFIDNYARQKAERRARKGGPNA